jgi:hypothetical protein
LSKEENDAENQLVTIRVPKVLLKAFDEKVVPTGSTRAETWRKIMEEKVNASGGKVQGTVNYERLKEQRLKWKRIGDSLYKILSDENTVDRYRGVTPVYEVLLSFAKTLGTDDCLVLNINDVLEKLKRYAIKPNESFNDAMLESFIEYVEALLRRRQIEVEIRAFRCKET